MAAVPILFYDGVCNFCDASVRFVLRHERGTELRFAALQSQAARQYLAPLGVAADDLTSMLVLDGDRLLRESDAALHVAGFLRRPWCWLRLLHWIPRCLRDGIYRLIGRHRYRWWGRRQTCIVAPPSLRARFLD